MVVFKDKQGTKCSSAVVAFGQQEAEKREEELRNWVRDEGCKVLWSSIKPGKPAPHGIGNGW